MWLSHNFCSTSKCKLAAPFDIFGEFRMAHLHTASLPFKILSENCLATASSFSAKT
jgi:hypothetical protein